MNTTKKQRTANIYALVDEHNDIRYVGSTGMDVQDRSAIHHRHRNSDTSRGNPELNAWLRSLEHPPKAVLLQEVAWADRIKAETHWTRWARQTHGRLMFNKMDGATPTDELAARKKAQRLGHYKPHTTEGRSRISAGVRKAAARRRSFVAEEALLGSVYGKLFRLPRTADELREQVRQASEDHRAAA